MGTEADDKLEQFLKQQGFAWAIIEWERHVDLCNEWEISYGNVSRWNRSKKGAKAQFEYSQETAESFKIIPFLGDVAGVHSINKGGPRTTTYQCGGGGSVPDLSAFKNTDFFIIPDDLSWTMIHTHEDHGLVGPYFIRKDWLGSPGSPNKKTRRIGRS